MCALPQDGGGSIDSKELKDLMASVGQNPTDDELAEMIRIADADGTGACAVLPRASHVLRCVHPPPFSPAHPVEICMHARVQATLTLLNS